MEGTFLRFYVEERQTHGDSLLWEWLLGKAKDLGLRGGSAFRSIGGFGRHRELHEARFFELAGDTGIEVAFITTEEEAKLFLSLIKKEGIRAFYSRIPAEFGVINPDSADPSAIEANC